MNINETLLIELSRLSDVLGFYDCTIDDIKIFLMHPENIRRQEKAIEIIQKIMTQHGKGRLLDYVVELARVQHGIQELEPWVRDHVVHSVLSFLLGIYLNENFLSLKGCADRKLSRTLGIDANTNCLVNSFEWELAGLFHDIGYPAEIAGSLLTPLSKKINEIKKELNINQPPPDIKFTIVPVGLEKLTNNQNSFDLIQQQLDEWQLTIDAKKEYEKSINDYKDHERGIDHGMMSALILLYVIDLMYQKYNPNRAHEEIMVSEGFKINFNQGNFENKIVPVCAAIYIHNLPDTCFSEAKIDREYAPLPYLLKLADCLQEWERPRYKDRKGISAKKFDIWVDDTLLVFQAQIPKDMKEELMRKLNSNLKPVYDIRIQ